MWTKIMGGTGLFAVYKWLSISLLLLAVFLFFTSIATIKRIDSIGKEVYPQSTVVVTGEGEAYAVPDIASFTFTIREEAKTAKEAQTKAETKIKQALAVLDDADVDEKDIKTIGYSVYPKYEWQESIGTPSPISTIEIGYAPRGKQVLIGYEISQSTLVKVREIDIAGDLVTKVGAVGVSDISGVEFTIDDREQFANKARAEAIEKAKAQAKVLSKSLGVRLGKMLFYTEDGRSLYPQADYGGAEMSLMKITPTGAPIPASLNTGETKVTSRVSITFEIR